MTHSPSKELPGWAAVLVPALFFFSGASGLVYEVVWTRVLLNVFGATVYAVATVLAAFMGGLALGSLLGGRLADRSEQPLRLFGILEGMVGLSAAAVPFLLRLFDPVYQTIYASGETSFLALSLVRFAVCCLVLLLPTTCMGATLPVLSRFLVRSRSALGGRVGALYALNTTGAVAGTFLAGFVLISRLGVLGTLILAGCVSIAVGLAAITLSRRLVFGREKAESATVAGDDQPEQSSRLATLVLATYGVSGFAALALQVLWTRSLVFRFEILKNTTYSFSAMLTVFLVGLAAGSALMSLVVNRLESPARMYGLLQLATGVASALSLTTLLLPTGALAVADPLRADGSFVWGVAVANVFVRTASTILVPTLLMGMTFPLAARLAVRSVHQVGTSVGRLYAVNTVGAILGSFVAGFALIPAAGLARAIVYLGLLYVLAGAAVLVGNPDERTALRIGSAGLAAAVLVALVIAMPGGTSFQEVPPGHHLVLDEDGRPAYAEGALATVVVLESSIGHRTIHIDNVPVAGTDRILLTDQKSLAHVPALLLERPRSALTVGFGSGGASWSYLLYPELEQVDCVEICDTVPLMAHTLRDSNHGLMDGWDRRSSLVGQRFHGGRFRVIVDDARSYLRFTRTRYDIIATDCTDLRYKSNANLYDVEYFRLCREAITEDGMVVVWMPLGGMSPAVFACALRTFASVFPDMTIWYMNNEPTHYLLLIGTRKPLHVNLGRLLERARRPEISRDLAEVSLHQPEKLLSCFVTEAPAVEEQLRRLNPVLNTENTPYLEFESPRFGLGDEPLLANLELLFQQRRPVAPYLQDGAAHPELLARLDRFVAAVEPIRRGHTHLRRLELEAAAEAYLEAQAICPEDESVEFLLGFDDLRRRAANDPYDGWSRLNLAEIALARDRANEAGEWFRQVYQLTDQRDEPRARALFSRSVVGLAECLRRVGEARSAQHLLERYAAQVEGQPGLAELRAALAGG